MPRFDLRKGSTSLDPLAPFKVLAVMCHPGSRVRREGMMSLLHTQTGSGRPRRKPLSDDAFMREVKLTSARAGVAGGLLLTRLQLHGNGYAHSLNNAVPLVTGLLPHWEQPVGPHWSKDVHVSHRPRSRRKMLEVYRQYRPVAHLWAAMVHGLQHAREDIWPGSLPTLPIFISYADAILELACALLSAARDRRFVLSRSEAWTFTIPANRKTAVDLRALPLHESQQRILNEHQVGNLLI